MQFTKRKNITTNNNTNTPYRYPEINTNNRYPEKNTNNNNTPNTTDNNTTTKEEEEVEEEEEEEEEEVGPRPVTAAITPNNSYVECQVSIWSGLVSADEWRVRSNIQTRPQTNEDEWRGGEIRN
ncbi:hypothetical protein Pmani_027863 [Petrolisthes manimaculis]|uniref:Uncharacterized protein n=1 Tax=Petrolisthes manimaculis TaxID=1843537 RepID=A0AAE1P2P4_9EUCA|nr:hypothetical protein Pmani_027863 [Petrolisthes manimaculis]